MLYAVNINNMNYAFSKKNTNWLRAVGSVILIMIHTIEEYSYNSNFFLENLGKCGFLVVSLFFLLSGYGLNKSKLKDPIKYISNFNKTRYFNILIPLLLVWIVYSFFSIILDNVSFSFNFLNIVCYSWFVVVILGVYVCFYICNRISLNYGTLLLSLVICLFIIISITYNIPPIYSKCLSSILLGLWLPILEDKKRIIAILFFCLSLFLAIGVLVLTNNLIISSLCKVYIFSVSVYLFSRFISFDSAFLRYISNHSYLIYLLHGLSIKIIMERYGPESSFFFSLVMIFLVTMILAVFTKKVEVVVIEQIKKYV